ncbi:SDR family NAD(P)-dependent oxidoreductase [Pseudooceanicola nanhaiensis]|uniref:SDR family NAD(P)-dependent oxidoreductase n=1 Tax=Pseudooceanicola nanhaiensis TaxID=375761 RepID=UPI001CD51332|nr:SDR family oxidoreductase [Pseudooceanicola nanhaiensis]MCA0922493.1 SDR family oxidoreductase [Pseudooceanicola nanhaiensis]
MTRYIVIGAGSGIGAALARQLAAPEVELLLHTGSNGDRLARVAADCEKAGAKVFTCLGLTEDPALVEGIAGWLATVPEGGLSGFAFAAGYAKLGTVETTDPEALRTALDAMPMAFQRLCTLVAPKLAEGRGRILCVSAFGAHRAKTHSYAPTAPAKAALEAQVRVFAANLAPRGITVNAVVPGFISKEAGTPSSLTPEQWAEVTATIPMARLGQAAEVAATAAFLLSEPAGYVTGQCLHVNGGLTL